MEMGMWENGERELGWGLTGNLDEEEGEGGK